MLTDTGTWKGRKILVAEDNLLLAEVLCEFLVDLGLEVVGAVGRVDAACTLARERSLDGAVLDIQLHNQLVFPVSQILMSRKVPFIFLTGLFHLSQIPEQFANALTVRKPFDPDALKATLSQMLDAPLPS